MTSIISKFKQYTTYHIWRKIECKPVLQRNFWREHTFWSDEYFVSSIGQASRETIEEYIRQQG
jgi:putative transposase